MNQIFQMKYILYILVGQEAAKLSEVKVWGQKESARSADPDKSVSNQAESAFFISTSNFDLWYFFSLLIYMVKQ